MEIAAQNASHFTIPTSHISDYKRQRVDTMAPLRVQNVTPTPAEWSQPCEEYIESEVEGKPLRDALETAEKFAPRAVSTPYTEAVERERAERVALSVRKGMHELVVSIICKAHKRLTSLAPVLKIPMPDLTLTPDQERAVFQISLWRVTQLWYGVRSQQEVTMSENVRKHLNMVSDQDPNAPNHIVVAMFFNLCVAAQRKEGGDALMFAPVMGRRFFNNDCPLLDDMLAVYCLCETCSTGVVYLHASERLRYDLIFNLHLVAMGGDDILSRMDPLLYNTPATSRLVRAARLTHYKRHTHRRPWLQILATKPLFIVGRTTLDLFQIDEWRTA